VWAFCPKKAQNTSLVALTSSTSGRTCLSVKWGVWSPCGSTQPARRERIPHCLCLRRSFYLACWPRSVRCFPDLPSSIFSPLLSWLMSLVPSQAIMLHHDLFIVRSAAHKWTQRLSRVQLFYLRAYARSSGCLRRTSMGGLSAVFEPPSYTDIMAIILRPLLHVADPQLFDDLAYCCVSKTKPTPPHV